MKSRPSSEMHWQDNFPFEARRRRNSGSRSGCVGGWRPASWPVEARSGRARARVRPGGAATSPRVPRSLADPQLWAWTRSPAHRRAVSGDPPPPGPRPRAVALVHESELARNDPHPEAPHLPISYDSGPPRSVIRFRMLHASSASALCPPGVRARRPVPMIDLYLKKAFSTRACRW